MGQFDENTWHVQFPWGDVRRMTLSELDASFDAGVINANTLVLEAGQYEWKTLREAAGLDDEPAPESESVYSSSPPPASIDVPSVGPLAAEIELDDHAFEPRSRSKVWTFLAALTVIGGVGFAGHEAGWRLEAYKSVRTPFSAAFAAVRDARTWQVTQATVVEVPPPAPPSLDCATCPQNMTEAQKKAAAAAEQKAEQKRAAKKARAMQSKQSSKAKAVFTNGGDKLDPLNGKI
jgi:hypothetical protein